MADPLVTVADYRGRLESLCLGGVGPGLPRKRRDACILLRSALTAFPPGQAFPQAQVDAALELWVAGVGPRVDLDRASIRRALIDLGYLVRDDRGSEYRRAELLPGPVGFEEGVDRIDPGDLIREARGRLERKRREHTR